MDDGGLAAFRFRQREETRRRREDERRRIKYKRGGLLTTTATAKTTAKSDGEEAFARVGDDDTTEKAGRFVSAVVSKGGSMGVAAAGRVSGDAIAAADDIDNDGIGALLPKRAAALRRRRLEAEKEKKAREEGLRLIRELYPEAAPPSPPPTPTSPALASGPASAPSPSAALTKTMSSSNGAFRWSLVPTEEDMEKKQDLDDGSYKRRLASRRKDADGHEQTRAEAGGKGNGWRSRYGPSRPGIRSSLAAFSSFSSSSSSPTPPLSSSPSSPSLSDRAGRVSKSAARHVASLDEERPPSPSPSPSPSLTWTKRIKSPPIHVQGDDAQRRHQHYQRRRQRRRDEPTSAANDVDKDDNNDNHDDDELDLVAIGKALERRREEERKIRAAEEEQETDELRRAAKKVEWDRRKERERMEWEERRKKRVAELRELIMQNRKKEAEAVAAAEGGEKGAGEENNDNDDDDDDGDDMEADCWSKVGTNTLRTADNNENDDDDDHDELMKLSRRLEQKKAAKAKKDRKHNPIAIMRREEEKVNDIINQMVNSTRKQKRRLENNVGGGEGTDKVWEEKEKVSQKFRASKRPQQQPPPDDENDDKAKSDGKKPETWTLAKRRKIESDMAKGDKATAGLAFPMQHEAAAKAVTTATATVATTTTKSCSLGGRPVAKCDADDDDDDDDDIWNDAFDSDRDPISDGDGSTARLSALSAAAGGRGRSDDIDWKRTIRPRPTPSLHRRRVATEAESAPCDVIDNVAGSALPRSRPHQRRRERHLPATTFGSESSSALAKSPGKKTGASDALYVRRRLESVRWDGGGDGGDKDVTDDDYDDDDDDDDEEEKNRLLSKLHPHFDDPKLGAGPLEALELDLPPAEGKEGETRGPLCRLPPSDDDGGGDDGPGASDVTRHLVPASINRYLHPYQQEGVRFVHALLVRGRGCILGDDMGLGKTIQIIAVLAALQGKTGTAMDQRSMSRRQGRISDGLRKERERRERALLAGYATGARMTPLKGKGSGGGGGAKGVGSINFEARAEASGRILIVVPSSVVKNWSNEFEAWGHFSVAFYQDKDRSVALDRAKYGLDEVLVVSRSLFARKGKDGMKGHFEEINSLKWRLVIVDEFHEYKNHRSLAFECLEQLRTDSRCPVVGMTGTVLQNNYRELWNLVDLVQPGLLGSWKEFDVQTAKPLLLMRTKTAQDDILELGNKRQADLDRALTRVYIQRYKKDVLRDELTEKRERVIFCPLSDVQKTIYRNIMSLPDYYLLRSANAPCDCGVNRKYFIGYRKMRNKKEQIDYERRHRNELVRMKDCCYRVPYNARKDGPNEPLIDKDAVIWRSMHPDDQECNREEKRHSCPTCILLPALQKLYKVSSHAALLQAEKDPNLLAKGTAEYEKARKDFDFARVALPSEVLPHLPGGSYIRQDGIMDSHTALSGKMKRFDEYLRFFRKGRNRVLVFSYSTKTLDLIQNYVKSQGYTYRRLDGNIPTKKRQAMIDEFQLDETIFLFLISTKAGGLGLNLTAANKVIVFDVNWNPSYDEQAQDRAFRIGQNRDVEVVRLVAQGTVEELMYIRQVYKVHLKLQTLGSGGTDTAASAEGLRGAQPRIFRGVAGDRHRKGELFGLENLLKFKDGSFMADLWTSKGRGDKDGSQTNENSLGVIDVSAVAGALSSMTDGQMKCLGGDEYSDSIDCVPKKSVMNHDDFLWDDRGEALLKPGDEGFEEEMGGESQIVHVTSKMVCDQIRDEGYESQGLLGDVGLNRVSPSVGRNRLVTITEGACLDVAGTKDKSTLSSVGRNPQGKVCPHSTVTALVSMGCRAKPATSPNAKKPTPDNSVKSILLGNLPADCEKLQKSSLLEILHIPAYSKKKKRKKGKDAPKTD